MKCEIETCNEQTENFLCKVHTSIAKSKFAKFKICNKCNVIVEVRIDKISKDLTKSEIRYTFVDECQTCKFK